MTLIITFWCYRRLQKPPGKAPPPPKMWFTHPQQRWNIQRKQESWFQIPPPDGAQEEIILANYIQCSNKEEECRKKINYSSTSQEHIPTHIHAKSFKNVEIHRHLNRPRRTWHFNSMRCSRKDRMTGKQLYEANHFCMMNPNYQRKSTRNLPPQQLIYPE
jgi:hypothetical protein